MEIVINIVLYCLFFDFCKYFWCHLNTDLRQFYIDWHQQRQVLPDGVFHLQPSAILQRGGGELKSCHHQGLHLPQDGPQLRHRQEDQAGRGPQ